MADKTSAELQADWIAQDIIARFHEKLNTATQEDRYKILAMLLANEFESFPAEQSTIAEMSQR